MSELKVGKAEILKCGCQVIYRGKNEPERNWFKRYMCMFHWMQTDYYRAKFKKLYKEIKDEQSKAST